MSLITGNENKIFAKGVIGNVRKAQEDSHGWKLGTPNGDLFVVCDGMGGHVGGAMASKIAVESIIEYITTERYSSPEEALDGALQFANMQILGYADAHPEYKGMGTTACIVLVRDRDVEIAHVGDSRIYLYLWKEQQLHRITKDHSFVQTLVDAGIITDEEAEHHPNKNRILKALGIKPELQPSFNCVHPKNGDIFLICSDGLSGMIPDKTIKQVLDEGTMSLEQKGEKLIELAMQGETVQPGGQDNCTVELIEVDNSKGRKSVFKSYNPNQVLEKSIRKDPVSGRKLIKTILVAMLSLLVLGAVVWRFLPPSLEKQISQLEGEVSELESNLDSLQNKLNSIEKHKKEIETQKKSALTIENVATTDSNDVVKWNKQIKQDEDDIEQIDKNRKQLQEEKKSKETRLNELKKKQKTVKK